MARLGNRQLRGGRERQRRALNNGTTRREFKATGGHNWPFGVQGRGLHRGTGEEQMASRREVTGDWRLALVGAGDGYAVCVVSHVTFSRHFVDAVDGGPEVQ